MKRIALLLIVLLLLCPFACAEETAEEHEISSYVIYADLNTDGSVRVREEVIFNCAAEYAGYVFRVDTPGGFAIDDIDVWADGEPLTEGSNDRTAEDTYDVQVSDELAIIDVYSPGINEWRTFACEYTLSGVLTRYEDACFAKCVIIPEDEEYLQNATVIITLPYEVTDSDGTMIVISGAIDNNSLKVQGDKLYAGPVDIKAGNSVDMMVLMPDEHFGDMPVTSGTIRDYAEGIVKKEEQEKERLLKELKAKKHAYLAGYLAGCLALLIWLLVKYGMNGKRMGELSRELFAYSPALAGYICDDAVSIRSASAVIAKLVSAGEVVIRRKDERLVLQLIHKNAQLKKHEKAAVELLFRFSNTVYADELSCKNYEKGHQYEKAYDAFITAMQEDAKSEGLRYGNEGLVIFASSFAIIGGILVVVMMLMINPPMLIEALIAGVVMFVISKLYNAVTRLTPEGEALKKALNESKSMPLSFAAALGKANEIDGEQAQLISELSAALQNAHNHNAALPKERKIRLNFKKHKKQKQN